MACSGSEFSGLPPIFSECGELAGDDPATILRFDRPWVHGGHVYATNRVIAVRVPVGSVAPEVVRRCEVGPRILHPAPAFYTAYSRAQDSGVDLPLPDVGMGTVECPYCDDSGGNDEVPCPECCGGKRLDDVRLVPLGPYYYTAYYVALLRRHGVRMLVVPREMPDYASGSVPPAGFRAGAVEGMLMPCYPPDSDCELYPYDLYAPMTSAPRTIRHGS